jgi:hypothetical protein
MSVSTGDFLTVLTMSVSTGDFLIVSTSFFKGLAGG